VVWYIAPYSNFATKLLFGGEQKEYYLGGKNNSYLGTTPKVLFGGSIWWNFRQIAIKNEATK
jgi:hypothetical protein